MTQKLSNEDLLPCGCAVPGETDAATCYCGVDDLLRIIRRRYALAVMNAIHMRRRVRYQDVATALPTASSSTLAETLRALNTAGLVTKDTNPDYGPNTYALTASGAKLLSRLRRLLEEVQP